MTLTREQVEKYNAKMHNMWRFDIRYFMYHGEKCPTLRIKVDDTNYVQARLWYTDEKQDMRYTGYKFPQLHLSLWTQQEHSDVSSGLGEFITVGERVKRGTLANLSKITAQFTPEHILEIAKQRGLIR